MEDSDSPSVNPSRVEPPGAPPTTRRLARFVVRIAKRIEAVWSGHRISSLSAEIAFFGMLALFPALLAIAAALGFLSNIVGEDVASQVQDQVISGLNDIFTEQASGGIESVQQIFEESSRGVVAVAAIAAVWAMSRTMHSVMGALSIVYGVPEARGWVKTRLLALLFSIISVFAVAGTLTLFVVGPLVGSGSSLAERLGFEDGFVTFWSYVRYPLAFVVLACFAAVVFHLAPNGRRDWRWDFPGAAVTTVLWLVCSVGLRLYIELASAGNGIYAVLGGALIVLVWLYLLGMSLIIGGEVNAALLTSRAKKPVVKRRFGRTRKQAGRLAGSIWSRSRD